MDLELDEGAVDRLFASAEVSGHLYSKAEKVARRARLNARSVSPYLVDAIQTEHGIDARGPYVDIGYNKRKPGFVLWWWEVGNRNHRARPHLRPALLSEAALS